MGGARHLWALPTPDPLSGAVYDRFISTEG
jgi:hypothetical protein